MPDRSPKSLSFGDSMFIAYYGESEQARGVTPMPPPISSRPWKASSKPVA